MGKTVFVTQWLRSEAFDGVDVRWVRAPESAGDPGELWRRIHDALRGPDAPERPSATGRAVVERMVSGLRRTTVLVVDDYQRVTGPQLDLQFAGLLRLSERLHLVAISRRFEVLDGPLVTSQTTATVLQEKDLAFTLEEAHAFAELAGLQRPDLVARLHEFSRGWPVAMRLTVQQLAEGAGDRDLAAQLSRFVTQHIEGVSDESRRVLSASALCEGLGSDLAAEALGLPAERCTAIMRELGELGLVSQTWYPDTIRLSCHPGFVRTLRARAEQEFGAAGARRLRYRHAVDLSRDEPIRGVVQFLELGELDRASRVLARRFLEAVDADTGLLGPLRRLSVDELRGHPVLVGARLLLEMGDLRSAGGTIDALHRLLRESSRGRLLQADGELLIPTLSMLVVAERMRGDGSEALRLSRDLEQRLAVASEQTTTALSRSMSLIHAVIALAGLLGGDLELALRGFTDSLRSAEALRDDDEQHRAWNGLAIVAAMSGEVGRARACLDRAEVPRARTGRSSPHLSWVNGVAAHALLALEDSDRGSLHRALAEVEAIKTKVEQWPIIAVSEAALVRIADGSRAALRVVEERTAEAEGTFRTTLFMRGLLTAYAADVAATSGNYLLAERLLDEMPDAHPYSSVARARLRLLTGDEGEAITIAAGALREGRPARRAAEAGLVTAVALWRLGQETQAREAFAASARIMLRTGLRSPLATVPYGSLLELAEKEAGASDTEQAGIAELLEVVRRIPERLRCEPFEALSRAELRTLEALAAGRTIAATAEALFLTQNTVKFHLRSVYRKLRVSGRVDAVLQARRMGLLPEAEQPAA